MLLLLISSGVTMAVPFCIGKLIDFIQSCDKSEIKEKLRNIALILTGVFIVGAIANFGRVLIIQSTGQKIVMRLRTRLFKSIMNQEMGFFDKNKTGELINRLSSDTEVVGLSISQNLSDGLRSVIQAGAGIGMMIYMSPYLAIVGLSSIPAVTMFAIFFGRYIKKISKQVQDVLAEATDVIYLPLKYIFFQFNHTSLYLKINRWLKKSSAIFEQFELLLKKKKRLLVMLRVLIK